MPQRLYSGSEVCELARLQPYVLRSWEKEFPGIGFQESAHGSRVYRQEDLDHVLRIRQLVFDEGLTLGGARRRLESGERPSTPPQRPPVLPLGPPDDDLRRRVGLVRDGLRSLLEMLNHQAAPPALAASAALVRGAALPGKARVSSEKPKRSRVRV